HHLQHLAGNGLFHAADDGGLRQHPSFLYRNRAGGGGQRLAALPGRHLPAGAAAVLDGAGAHHLVDLQRVLALPPDPGRAGFPDGDRGHPHVPGGVPLLRVWAGQRHRRGGHGDQPAVGQRLPDQPTPPGGAFVMRLVRFVLARIGFYVLVVLIGSFFALPLLWLFTAPFHPQATLSVQLPTEPTLANFAAVFRNTFAVRALFQNSVIQAGGAMILTTLVASLAAFALARVRLPGRDVLVYVLILFSSVVTGTAAMVPIFLLIFHMGLIDTHLGVILVFTGGLLPTAIFIMRDFVAGLPRSLEESAMVAGAGSWQILRQIVLPQVRPGMMEMAVG